MKKNAADKARIHTGKKVIGVTINKDNIEVFCGDGTTFCGSVVIGADGVHSKVRQSMRNLAIECSERKFNVEKPYLSEYKVLWCTFPRQPCNEPGDTVEIHGRDVSLQCINSQKRSWLFIYEKLAAPTRDCVSYSQQDVEEFATRHGELAVCEHLKVKDVFPKCHTAGMSNLEEGIVEHWSWGRMVLVGDACHKFTPNQGLGYNNGIQDLVALVNELNRTLSDEHRSGGAALSLDSLTRVFSRYQAARMELLQNDMKSSASWTRMSAWRNCILHLLDRYVLPAVPKMDEFAITHMVSGPVSRMLVLDFIESEEPFRGTVGWKHSMKVPKPTKEEISVSSWDSS
ncbi:hypothetical protein KVR01_006165 [Diaporthe batatas]|uniref:uncharacterized protein n=1 Tax=Diaporthe batatas TaxID=748121 RepID=UPI001D039336|nr:uncharacterized protein KVR01_006165 [Diaporthe batatas]KAG8164247.1 hypothetical protein KVR01_006165 [Diaporthe batatas]